MREYLEESVSKPGRMLKAGEEFPLGELKEIFLGASFEMEWYKEIDLNTCALLGKGKEAELIYYANHEDEAKSIHLHTDLYAPPGAEHNDDELVDIDLNKVPERYDRIILFFADYNARSISSLKGLSVRLVDKNTREEVACFEIDPANMECSAIAMVGLYRRDAGWVMKGIGRPLGMHKALEAAEALMGMDDL